MVQGVSVSVSSVAGRRREVETGGSVSCSLLRSGVTGLLDVDLASTAPHQLYTDLIAAALPLPGPLGGDGAAAQVHLHLQTRLHPVLLLLDTLILETIRQNLHWRTVVSGGLRTQSEVDCGAERTGGGASVRIQTMLDDEGVEGFNVGVESEELVFRVRRSRVEHRSRCGDAGVGGTVTDLAAVVVVVSPDQLLTRGLRRPPVFSPLIKLLPLGKYFAKWILTDNGFPIDSVQNCFASEKEVKVINIWCRGQE